MNFSNSSNNSNNVSGFNNDCCDNDRCDRDCNNCQCCVGPQGPRGPRGEVGPRGPRGEAGEPGGIADYADFYAIIPADSEILVEPGEDISFPLNGPTSSTDITRISETLFNLAEIGTYLIMFQITVNEAGQLVLTLNGNELAYTVVGREALGGQIIGMVLITTTQANSTITVRNPSANADALTVTPRAGGNLPVSAHLVITRLS